MTEDAKERLYNAVAKPYLRHFRETWVLTEDDKRRLET
jgi:hypothetical protein